jgi:hypothetical protein
LLRASSNGSYAWSDSVFRYDAWVPVIRIRKLRAVKIVGAHLLATKINEIPACVAFRSSGADRGPPSRSALATCDGQPRRDRGNDLVPASQARIPPPRRTLGNTLQWLF